MRYRDAWWVVFEHGWVRVHDDLVEHDLDRIATRMTAAEDACAEGDAFDDVPLHGDCDGEYADDGGGRCGRGEVELGGELAAPSRTTVNDPECR